MKSCRPRYLIESGEEIFKRKLFSGLNAGFSGVKAGYKEFRALRST